MAVDNYRFVNALLWMCRTGAPWRDLPECYGKWITVCRRFDRWSGNGAMERLFTALQEERIIAVEVWVLAMDSTSVKVHQHATGAPKKKGSRSVGVSRGGRDAKVRVASDSGSTLVEIHPGPGNEHDAAHERAAHGSARRVDALILPVTAVAGRLASGQVSRRDGDSFATVNVKLGASDGTSIIILDGLEEGDMVSATAPNLTLGAQS